MSEFRKSRSTDLLLTLSDSSLAELRIIAEKVAKKANSERPEALESTSPITADYILYLKDGTRIRSDNFDDFLKSFPVNGKNLEGFAAQGGETIYSYFQVRASAGNYNCAHVTIEISSKDEGFFYTVDQDSTKFIESITSPYTRYQKQDAVKIAIFATVLFIAGSAAIGYVTNNPDAALLGATVSSLLGAGVAILVSYVRRSC